ncbi:MAG: alpha/beta hydrolase [Candidatus Omnitrophica bacterium]|nr:alpha/beta hydrolase [Candidatus Omnitrophota bacterium]MCF7877827.1 alpha/beta hydrolase [Candidatus Omnitrophota bacterium]MCF7892226.1 alpha/beta hydrolase [Candidatus Omnitrophota bacterium]MCF7895974.1 alpha/beta hydrolase [Candidatus Omnitrophota bacterium]MCF7909983.1 alpha/beta hydrolase [Candidatus Omnitrophota bacterium]
MLKFFLAFLTLIIFTLFLFVKFSQNNQIFFPVEVVGSTPEDFGLSFEDVSIKTADNLKLNGWFIPNQPDSCVLLFLHGNGGNISHRLHKIGLLYDLGLTIFIIDYRGYGKSQGSPDVAGIYRDAQASLNYLTGKRNIEAGKIIVYGESLGTALAVNLAANNKVGGIILEGAFSSGKDMAKLIYPYFPSFILPNIFESSKDIERVNEPKLFIHSKTDEIVPVRLAKELYKKAPQPKKFIEIVGGHNTAYLDRKDKYLSALDNFIEKIKNGRYPGKNNE